MSHKRRGVSRRALVGLGLGLWVILVALAALRAQTDGPRWGMQVAMSTDGRAVAVSVDPLGSAGVLGVRLESEIIAIERPGRRPLRGFALSPSRSVS